MIQVTAKVFRVNCAPSVEQIDASLEGLQKFIGGYIEGIKLGSGYILYCNEDGRAKGLSPNLQLPNGVVVLGDAVMVRHNSEGEVVSLTEHEPEAIRKAFGHLTEDGNEHEPTPWIVIYHSQGDIFEVKVVEDKMVADGLAEDADKKTEGNVETLSLPARKLFEACNAHNPLVKERERLKEAFQEVRELISGTFRNVDLFDIVQKALDPYDDTKG